jgi:class 3 adenylate cyclase
VRNCAVCGRTSEGDFAFCPYCGADLAPALPPREQRKSVTVLFCDLTAFTALAESRDPEALSAVQARYFARMKAIVEAHGGKVEKFIGDAVMAVFGVPKLQGDDALRAARAALEMRNALPELGLQARLRINSGEVVTGGERLATGDVVNVAARLQQAARPNDILVGQATLALLADGADVEALEPLELKGKAAPVAAFRLLAVREPIWRHDGPMAGRESELRHLRSAFDAAVNDRACRLFTILGAAGAATTG